MPTTKMVGAFFPKPKVGHTFDANKTAWDIVILYQAQNNASSTTRHDGNIDPCSDFHDGYHLDTQQNNSCPSLPSNMLAEDVDYRDG